MKIRALAILGLLFAGDVHAAASTPFIVVNGKQLKTNGQIFNTQPVSGGGGPAVPGTAGVWYNITPAYPQTATIVVDAAVAGRVWVGLSYDGNGFYRSDDYGDTWTKANANTTLDSGGLLGVAWSGVQDPTDADVFYMASGYGYQDLWKTTDAGAHWANVLDTESTWHTYAQYNFTNNVSMDPADHNHLVISSHGYCEPPYSPSCFAETTNGGASWTLKVAPAAWEEGGGIIIVSGNTWIYCGNSYMKITTNAGSSWSNVTGGATSCEAQYTQRRFMPAANGKYYLGSRDGMLSSSNGTTWSKISGTSGLMVMVAYQDGGTKLFASNQWGKQLWKSTTSTDTVWTQITSPDAQIDAGGGQGMPFMAYDETHDILYTSMFGSGVARIKSP